MLTSTVCEGRQSCLNPQHVEPLTLRLRLAPAQSHSPQPIVQVGVTPHGTDSVSGIQEPEVDSSTNNENTEKNTSSGDFGGWSFLEALAKEAQEDKETTYAHPLDKRALPTLSSKSLDLCTETLGCETGSDIGDDSDLYYSSSSSDSESTRRFPTRERSRFCQPLHKKAIRRSFPPPLTSIRGSDYVQVTPHREGGRLVIKAIKIANATTCFQAERGNGRLRLQLRRSSNNSSSSDEDTEDDKEEKEHQEQDHHRLQDEKINANTGNAIVEYQRPCSWYKGSVNRRFKLETIFGSSYLKAPFPNSPSVLAQISCPLIFLFKFFLSFLKLNM